MWKCAIAGAILIATLCGLARSEEPVTCAVVPCSDETSELSAMKSFLEVALSQDPQVRLVERAKIDEVLKERKLQMLLGPSGVRDRRQLGELLRADLLILFQFQRAPHERAAFNQITIAETRQGLRLFTHRLPAAMDPATDASKIHEWVRRAIAMSRQDVFRVFAVPPFRTQDLLHEYDDLQWALARLVEQILTQNPGVVVVELQEADAISHELRLAGSEMEIRRRLPYYILGEYRNEGGRKNRTMSMTLRLRYGDDILRTVREEGLSPESFGDIVRSYVEEFGEQVLGPGVAPPSRGQEAEILARRADEFLETISWGEALSLLEASLLVKYDQPEVHRKIVYVLTQLARQDSRNEMMCLNACRSALDHLEYYLRSSQINNGNTMNFLSDYWACARDVEDSRQLSSMLAKLVSEINKEKRAMILRVMSAKAGQGQLDQPAADLLSYYPFYSYGKIDETPEENYADRLAAIRLIKDIPRTRHVVERLLPYERSVDLTDRAYAEFLNKLDEIDDPEVRAAVKQRRQYHENQRMIASRPAQPRPKPLTGFAEKTDERPDIAFEPLTLVSRSPGKADETLWNIGGFLACAGGIDFLWTNRAFHLIEHGQVRCIQVFSDAPGAMMEPCYDGTYVWMPVRCGDGSCLMVVDPTTGQVAKIGEDEGLPSFETRAVCAPVGPGKVCVAGGLQGRGWCALVSFRDGRTQEVDVFHEARRNVIRHSGDIAVVGDTHLAFIPLAMRTMSGSEEGSEPLVVIERSCQTAIGSKVYPLLVDPVERSVILLPVALGRGYPYRSVTSHEGALYWVGSSGYEGSYTLWCLRPNASDKTNLASGLPGEGFVIFMNGFIHIVGEKWVSARSLRDGFFEMKTEPLPGSWYDRGFWHTNHYGLVVTSEDRSFRVKLGAAFEDPNSLKRPGRSIYRRR
jgi:hypothetical protein